MDSRYERAFRLLDEHAYFDEGQAAELAASFGIVWDGSAYSTFRDGEKVFTRESLRAYFQHAIQTRIVPGFSTR